MSAVNFTPELAGSRITTALLPLMTVIFLAFLVIGAPMPVLPLHVHHGLGLGTFVVGLVAGAQFAAALLSRLWSGQFADNQGAKPAVLIGLLAAAAAGLLYLLSLRFVGTPSASVGVLLLGRAVLGAAESFIITGATIWGLARLGSHHAGKVIAWMGTAMFAGFAAGAPLGTALFESGGFRSVALLTTIASLITVILVAPLRGTDAVHRRGPGVLSVLRTIWLPGFGAALSSVGFGAIAAFGSLLFAGHQWTPVWLPFSAYAVALISARLLLGHLPDHIGGARVALAFVLVEALGLAAMGFATAGWIAALGSALTGFGYSLVFPALGVEAVRRAPPERRGVAMGAYTACLDLALGVSGPLLGLIAGGGGMDAVFLTSTAIVLGTVPIAIVTMRAGNTLSVGEKR